MKHVPKKLIMFLVVLVFGLVLAGASSALPNGDGSPQVTSVDPANCATDVYQYKVINVTFNEDIQPGTNYAGVAVRNAATGQQYSISKNIVGNQLLITGNPRWTAGTTFEIVIPKNSIQDLAGNQITDNFTSTFTASEGPSVVSFNPSNGADVQKNKQIVVTFNEAIQAGYSYHSITVRNAATKQGYSLTKSIVGNQLFISGKWTPGITFEIVIPKNSVADLDGNTNANLNSSNFTVTSVTFDPADGATDVNQFKQITVTFSHALSQGPNFNYITVRNAATKQGYSITKNIVGNQLIITGLVRWTPGTTFEIYIPAKALLDPFGNPNTSPYTSLFTSSFGPSVTSFDPVDGAIGVDPNQQIVVNCSEDIQPGVHYEGITVRTLSGQGYSITKNIVGNQLFITGKWKPGTTFEIVIAKDAIADLEGNCNANAYTSTFTVGGGT